MELEFIMSNEIREAQKDKYHTVAQKCEIKKLIILDHWLLKLGKQRKVRMGMVGHGHVWSMSSNIDRSRKLVCYTVRPGKTV